jgi:hypothetical protein
MINIAQGKANVERDTARYDQQVIQEHLDCISHEQGFQNLRFLRDFLLDSAVRILLVIFY